MLIASLQVYIMAGFKKYLESAATAATIAMAAATPACSAENCSLQGGTVEAQAYDGKPLNIDAQCAANKKLVYKCLAVGDGIVEGSQLHVLRCDDADRKAKAADLSANSDYVKCHGSENPDDIVASCTAK